MWQKYKNYYQCDKNIVSEATTDSVNENENHISYNDRKHVIITLKNLRNKISKRCLDDNMAFEEWKMEQNNLKVAKRG